MTKVMFLCFLILYVCKTNLNMNKMNIQELTANDLNKIADLISEKILNNEKFQQFGCLVDDIEFDLIDNDKKIDLSFIISGNFIAIYSTINRDDIKSIDPLIMSIEINSDSKSVSLSRSQIKHIENQF